MAIGTSRLVTALFLVASISACSSDDSTVEKKSITRVAIEDSVFKAVELEKTVDKLVTELQQTEAQDMRFSVNLKGVTGYWEPVVVGANRAMEELEIDGAVTSPPGTITGDEQTTVQVDMVKQDREAGSQGLGLAPLADPLVEEVNAAVDSGIPVVTVDSDLADSKRDYYVGTINAQAGKTGGESLKALLPSGSGTVIVLGNESEGWKDGFDRTMGAKDVLAAAGYNVVLRTTVWDEGGEEKDIAFMVETINTANPPVVGMIGMFSNAYRCAMAVEAAGKTSSDIKVAAFDLNRRRFHTCSLGLFRLPMPNVSTTWAT